MQVSVSFELLSQVTKFIYHVTLMDIERPQIQKCKCPSCIWTLPTDCEAHSLALNTLSGTEHTFWY